MRQSAGKGERVIMAKKAASINYPKVLAFERKIAPSDGYMSGTTWEKRYDTEPASYLHLSEKTVRGTISNYLKDKDLEAKMKNPNPQTVDSCALGVDQDTLVLQFTLKIVSGVENASAYDEPEFAEKYHTRVQSYIADQGLMELALRYAQNIANARFLWRNRVGAEELEVVVKETGSKEVVTFNSYDYSLKEFDPEERDENLTKLAHIIADALEGKEPYALLDVTAYAKLGKAQEVFPSQELVLNKEKGDKSKVLYAVNGKAAMHSQKIGNALRTIDTWYKDYDEVGTPIPAECYGAVTSRGLAYRANGDDFYKLFQKAMIKDAPLTEEEKLYVMAVLIRGGVFGMDK